MTTFRYEFVILIAALAVTQPLSAQSAVPGWTMLYSDQEELHKLIYVKAGDTEGESGAYLRCRTGEGWIFLIHDLPQPRPTEYSVVLRSGTVTIRPSFRVRYDGVDDRFYLDAAIPSDSRIFDAMAAGNSLSIDGTPYPVATPVERRTIQNFGKVCSSGD